MGNIAEGLKQINNPFMQPVVFNSIPQESVVYSPSYWTVISNWLRLKVLFKKISKHLRSLTMNYVCVCVCVCSVVLDSLQPHGLEPARLLCPLNFPGKNTGVEGHYPL